MCKQTLKDQYVGFRKLRIIIFSSPWNIYYIFHIHRVAAQKKYNNNYVYSCTFSKVSHLKVQHVRILV